MASSFHFYNALFTQLNNGLTNYVNNTATNIIGAITPVVTTLVTIYVCLWGWSMMRGIISEPIIDGVGRIVKLAIITALALSIGRYNSFLSDWLWNTPDALASYVGGGSGQSNAQYLDELWSKIYDFGAQYQQAAETNSSAFGVPDLSLLACAFGIWIAGIAATGYGAFLLALAKMALAICLGIGPLFIVGTMFEPTKKFFDAWIGQTLNYVIMVLLSSAAINLILTILNNYLGATGGVVTDPSINQAIPAIVFSVIGALVLTQMPSKASALAGGVALGTMGAVAWAYGKATGTARSTASAMRPTNMRREFRRAAMDVNLAKGAMRMAGGAPMAVYRKITKQTGNRVSRSG